ncbi:DgyrCDS14582 [Dimorphilus gyrociliatus]|uniref:DgyrCDS14582 n=1 Tax=Dimorphilus gyrociliatus TaxID=2664684 RepID=A0A7I8WE91_9ANNE|nr:DgyrCDS14582 [Dimorphilus gyrociliatus]
MWKHVIVSILFLTKLDIAVSDIGLICEHGNLNIACPDGKILRIVSAKYGRDKGDTKTCPNGSIGRFASRISSTNCEASTSFAKTIEICDDIQKCSIPAKNNLFGDPCRGILKYLRVDSNCVSANVPGYTLYNFKDYPNFDISHIGKSNRNACRDLCEKRYGCAGFVINSKTRACFLKKQAIASGSNFIQRINGDLYIRTTGPNVVSGYTMYVGKDYPGFDIKKFENISYKACSTFCDANSLCKAFEYHKTKAFCYLKREGRASGPNFKSHPLGIFFLKLDKLEGYDGYTGKDYPGFDIREYKDSNLKECAVYCNKQDNCVAFAFLKHSKSCYIKHKAEPSGENFKITERVDIYFKKNNENIKGYKRYRSKDYPGYDLKRYLNSNPIDCAKYCNETFGCFGTVFLLTQNICHLKSKMETSGPNFKDLKITDLYFRIQEPNSKRTILNCPSLFSNAQTVPGTIERRLCAVIEAKASIKGYKRYPSKDYPEYDIKRYLNSNPIDCAKYCDKTIGCFGTVFLLTQNICHLKSKIEISGPNFKDLKTTDLYLRNDKPNLNCKGYKRYPLKDYPGFDLKRYFKSNPIDCAKYCDKTIGCSGTVFLYTLNICHLKSKIETSSPNFKDLGITDVYLRIDGPSSIDEKFVCEHKSMTLSCPTGTGIFIFTAKYGRDKDDLSSCAKISKSLSNNCVSGLSKSKSIELCHGKQNCQIEATNSVFTDPCKGIVKNLRVQYKCINFKFKGYTHYPFKDYPGFDIKRINNVANSECIATCDKTKDCIGVLYHLTGEYCYLKHVSKASGPNFKHHPNSDLYIRSRPTSALDMYVKYPLKKYPGFDIKRLKNANPILCSETCDSNTRCVGFVYHPEKRVCYIKFEAKTSGLNYKTSARSDFYIKIGHNA